MHRILFSIKKNILLIIGLTYSFPALSNDEALELLYDRKVWLSIATMEMNGLVSPLVMKKWQIKQSFNPNKLLLNERTQLSIKTNEDGTANWMSRILTLDSNGIDCEVFTNMPFPIKAKFKRLPGDRLILEYDFGFKLTVVLVPSEPKKERRSPVKRIGVIEAPNLYQTKSIYKMPPIKYSNGYLHHDTSSDPKLVIVDNQFPKKFIPSVRQAVQKWNQALGFKAYDENIQQLAIKPSDCLSKNLLCINWQGPTDFLAWTGWGGIASNSFDPEDGTLIGGLVTLQNLRPTNTLTDTPQEVIDAYESSNLSSHFFASLMLRKEEFKGYRHPFENKLVESLLLHEIGHTNGFMHDFSASTKGTLHSISESFMDYLPFPLAFLNVEFGERDLNRLLTIYSKSNNEISYDNCSDEMEGSGTEVNCMKNDWGLSEIWYVDISSQAQKGVFQTVIEYLSDLHERNYLDLFSLFFRGNLTSNEQTQYVETFLCHQDNQESIKNELFSKYNIVLQCN